MPVSHFNITDDPLTEIVKTVIMLAERPSGLRTTGHHFAANPDGITARQAITQAVAYVRSRTLEARGEPLPSVEDIENAVYLGIYAARPGCILPIDSMPAPALIAALRTIRNP